MWPYLKVLLELVETRGRCYWSVGGVFDREECRAIRDRIDALGPALAPVSLPGGPTVREDIRTNERVMFEDAALAGELVSRVASTLPRSLVGRPLSGANPRLRGYRYREGQVFRPHYDGSYRPSPTLGSELTLLLYLNDGFEGGATRFVDDGVDVVPETGKVLVFAHHLLHEGVAVTAGTKYVLRTDVLYGA
ncbi:MAG: 2OG-Fe(II) oxygenase [Myxococcales bacterium]|nr:2OG-Fe(II) oxygenase [Myxococcales bacterium]